MKVNQIFGYLSTKNLYVVHVVNGKNPMHNTYLFNHALELPPEILDSSIDTIDMETIDNPDFIHYLNNSIGGNNILKLSQYLVKNRLVFIQITTK